MYRQAAVLNDNQIYLPAGDLYGDGWWSDRWDDVKKAAKNIQKSSVVRDIEKGAVNVGAKALRGVAETALDGVADAGATLVGAPELSPLIDAGIDKGLSALQKAGTRYVDQKIDKSGEGYRRMAPSGGGMRLAGMGTHVGNGLRLAGGSHGHRGYGLRLAGSGRHAKPLLEGSGNKMSCQCC